MIKVFRIDPHFVWDKGELRVKSVKVTKVKPKAKARAKPPVKSRKKAK